jgi:hypothetical protein
MASGSSSSGSSCTSLLAKRATAGHGHLHHTADFVHIYACMLQKWKSSITPVIQRRRTSVYTVGALVWRAHTAVVS